MLGMRAILNWIERETGLVSIIRHFLEEPLPKGVGWAHAFGSIALFVFMLQILTGIFMMIYYVPAPDHAYDSIEFMEQLAFGRIVRGIHHFGSSAMVIFVGVHMIQTWLWGAYKPPRQIIWVIGVFLLLLTLALAFTGYLLPWDQKAYWATVVGTNIAGSIPVIGEYLKLVLRSGVDVGAATLTRFYAIHVSLLPGLLILGIIFHIYQVRKKGITPPWSRVGEEPEEKPVLFYPDQAFKDLVAALVVLVALLFLAARFGAPLEERANPADTTYVPRPEWYFLPLFELLKHLPGQYGEFTGAILIPTIGVILLILFPYIDRNPERHPLKRPFAVGLMLFILVVATVFGTQGLMSMPSPKPLNAVERRGEKLFMDLRCSACHGINGGGGIAGPDLATLENRNPKRLETVLRNPRAFNPRSIMPNYSYLKEDAIKALVAYLSALGPGSRMPRVPRVGPKKPASHFEEDWMLEHKFEVRKGVVACASCHKPAFCQTCHQNRLPDSHLEGWMKAHFGTATEKPEYCAVCHEKRYCQKCHDDVLHTPNWITEHARGVKKRPEICRQCHEPRSFCIACHKGATPRSHTPGWIDRHGAQIAAGKESQRACFTCHERSFCASCHAGAKPAGHRQPDFLWAVAPRDTPREKSGHAREALQKGVASCATCHTPSFCDNCHGTPMPHPQDWLSVPSATSNTRRDSNSMLAATSLPHERRVALMLYIRNLGAGAEPAARCPAMGENIQSVAMAAGEGEALGMQQSRPAAVSGTAAQAKKNPTPEQTPSKRRVSRHAREARERPEVCARCHTQKYCLNCHQLEMPHPQGWATKHTESTLNKPAACARCHTPAECNKCHSELPPTSHDQENYAGKGHAEETRQRSSAFCSLCHPANYCTNCHRQKGINTKRR